MSKVVTYWALYFTSPDRSEGYSDFFDTYEEALNARAYDDGSIRIEEQKYLVDDDGSTLLRGIYEQL